MLVLDLSIVHNKLMHINQSAFHVCLITVAKAIYSIISIVNMFEITNEQHTMTNVIAFCMFD